MYRSGCLNVETGTLIDFDATSGTGFVEADDGRKLLLRATDVIPIATIELAPGLGVQFVQEESEEGPCAVVLALVTVPANRQQDRGQLGVD